MRKPSLLVIFLTVFIDLIGFGIVLPMVPLYGKDFGASGLAIGFIIASFSIMQFVFSPIWGRWSDRIGRRPIILISLAGGAISYGIFAYASTLHGATGLWLLLASRTFAGIFGGNINVAQAYIADISPPDQRSARMGLIGMAFGLGFIFGPPIGAFSARLGPAVPGLVAAALCFANFLLACFILPESWRPDSTCAEPRPHLSQWIHTLKQPQVGLLIGLFFIATFCFACYETTLALLVKGSFGYDKDDVGFLFAFSGVISALVQGGMIKRMVKRMGEARLILISFALTGASFFILPEARNLPELLIALAILSFGTSLNRPPTFGLISILTPTNEQGATLGVAQSVGSLARIAGPILAGMLFQFKPALPYFVCGGIALAAAWLARKSLPQIQPARSNPN